MVDIDKESSLLVRGYPRSYRGRRRGQGAWPRIPAPYRAHGRLLHLIDAYQPDVVAAYRTIQEELKAYENEGYDLSKKPQIVVLNKIDGLDKEIVDDLLKQLKKVVPKSTKLFAISAVAGTGVREFLYEVRKEVTAERKAAELLSEEDSIPVLTLQDTSASWNAEQTAAGFLITGKKIEQFASRTDFNNDEAVQRLRDIMKKMGILHDLVRKGIEAGQQIQIGDKGSLEY
jgi:GTP-binding protein